MTASRDPSLTRTSSVASSQASTSSQNAALSGATTAFGRSIANGRVPSSKVNGALAAATSAGLYRTSTSPARTSSTADSLHTVNSHLPRDVPRLNASKMSSPSLPPPLQRQFSKSPSQQAASVATARAPPPLDLNSNNETGNARPRTASTKTPAVPPKPRRLSSYTQKSEKTGAEKPTDATPIAPTTSLVDMFERKSVSPQPSGKRPEPIVIKPSNDLPMRSPKPVRTPSGITSMFRMELENAKTPPVQLPNDPTLHVSEVFNKNDAVSHVEPSNQTSKPIDIPQSPIPPPPRRRDPLPVPETSHLEPSKPSQPGRGRPGPSPSPLRSSATDPIPIESSSKSAISPTETFSPSSASTKSLAAQYNLLHHRRLTQNMTGDQLADAMVAGSLASSRHASPTRSMEPPPLPNRRHKHHTFSLSRTPSPSKVGMRKTLRQTQSDVSDDGEDERLYPYSKHKVQKRLGKHPNKHHEGDRKRWREMVTERERKRYEGVWAANKGLYCSFTAEEQKMFSKNPDSQQVQEIKEAVSDQVSNIVVREIWSRSRLQESVLETVWDLVDNERVGRLTKEEFVVGLWLIDGRLKGKKLPVKVSDSVWRSVKGLQKIKIKK